MHVERSFCIDSQLKNMKLQFCAYFLLFCFANANNFFKHHYEALLERIDVEYLNTSLANISLGMHFFNRSTKSLHGLVLFFTDITDNSYITVNEYQMFSNEYRLTAIQFEMRFRQMLQIEFAGIPKLFHSFKPPLAWPLRKRVEYRLNNWAQDSKNIPFPYAPTGKWKMLLSIYVDKKVTKICDVAAYNTVKDVPDI